MTLDSFVLALHVQGALMWIGGLFAVASFLDAHAAEPDRAARGRLLKFLKQAAIVPNIGATIAIALGTYQLVKYKFFKAPYMHPKLALVVVIIAIHGYLQMRVKKAKTGEPAAAPMALKPIISLVATGILIFVVAKWPR